MVCRTGMYTLMGDMITELLTPTRLVKEKDPFLPVRYFSQNVPELPLGKQHSVVMSSGVQ